MTVLLQNLPLVLLGVGALVVVMFAFRPGHRPAKAVVFLSSTSEFAELHPKLEAWIRKLGGYDPWSYKSDDATEERIEKMIGLSRVFVVLLGSRFGSAWKNSGKSIVQREFELALESLPTFAIRPFLRDPPVGSVDEQQRQFIERVRTYGTEVNCPEWDGEETLRTRLTEALSRSSQRYEEEHRRRGRLVNRILGLGLVPFLLFAIAVDRGFVGELAGKTGAYGGLAVLLVALVCFNIIHNEVE